MGLHARQPTAGHVAALVLTCHRGHCYRQQRPAHPACPYNTSSPSRERDAPAGQADDRAMQPGPEWGYGRAVPQRLRSTLGTLHRAAQLVGRYRLTAWSC
eukprot:162684-Chlamydomonas_euryale.AAC.4